mgnify:CR=1 FL=1
MNNFLETYKINSNDLEDFINIFKEDKREKFEKNLVVDKSNLKKDLKNKKLTITCRAFIMFMTNNLNTPKRNIKEIIIDKLPPLPAPPIIKENEEDDDDDEALDVEEDNMYIISVDDDGSSSIRPDMDKWRENQKRLREEASAGLCLPPVKQFTEKDLYESIEWITLEKSNDIPDHTRDFVKSGEDCYWEGIHDGLVIIYRNLKA